MRRVSLSAILIVAATTATLPAQSLQSRDLNRRGAAVERLLVWVEAVRKHQPETLDEATERIALWTPAQLDDLSIDLIALLKLMEAPRELWRALGSSAAFTARDFSAV